MLLKLYNIDCDAIRMGCHVNKQPLTNPLDVSDCCNKGGLLLFALHIPIHSLFICPKSISPMNPTRALLWTFLLFLFIYVYVHVMCTAASCRVFLSLPSLSVSPGTLTWLPSTKVRFIGAILHLLEATDCCIMKALLIDLFFICPRVVIAGFQPCLEISYYLLR